MPETILNWVLVGAGALIGLLVVWWVIRRLLRGLRHKLLLSNYGDAEFVDAIMDGQIMRGMSMEMVKEVWGEPADLDETALKTKTKQEMKYDQKGKNRFGTRVYLEDGVVVGWETK